MHVEEYVIWAGRQHKNKEQNYEFYSISSLRQFIEGWEQLKQNLVNPNVLLPDDNEINRVACDEMQQDWNDLNYQEIYRDGFVEGATWLRNKIKTGNGA